MPFLEKKKKKKKTNIKGLQAQQSVSEAFKTVDDLEDRTKSNCKNRTVVPGSFAEEKLEDTKQRKMKVRAFINNRRRRRRF